MSGGEILLRVKAMPNAGKSAVGALKGDELVVRIAAPPEKGKANRELLDVLAGALGLPRSSLRVVSGESSRHKVVALPGAAKARLEALLPRGTDRG